MLANAVLKSILDFLLCWTSRATPSDIERIYKTILRRLPEHEKMLVGRRKLDVALDVATSDESRNIIIGDFVRKRIAHDFLEKTARDSGIAVSRTPAGLLANYVSDKVIGGMVRDSGGFQEAQVDFALGIVRQRFPTFEPDLFVDVGANIGTHAIYALKHGFNRAVCIEPENANFLLLRVNLILNEIDERCVCMQCGASDSEEVVQLELSDTNFGDHRIVSDDANPDRVYGEAERERTQIRTRPLDTMIDELGWFPADGSGLIWIDTQGHEARVLAGAPRLLASKNPVVIEFWPYGLYRQSGYVELRNILSSSGRTVIDLGRTEREGRNVVVTPRELDKLYDDLIAAERARAAAQTDLLLLPD